MFAGVVFVASKTCYDNILGNVVYKPDNTVSTTWRRLLTSCCHTITSLMPHRRAYKGEKRYRSSKVSVWSLSCVSFSIYKVTRGPWTATRALIKVMSKRLILKRKKIYSNLLQFSGKTHSMCGQLFKSNQKSPFL